MMVASKLISFAIIFASVIIGFISYYALSDLSMEQKKKNMEEMISQLINFIVFIWIAKIILNLNVVISDPLVVLAYPSSSGAFYLAVLISALLLLYKGMRKRINVLEFLKSSLPVFLVTSFTYEVIQFVYEDNAYSFGYLILLAILLVIYFLCMERITHSTMFIFLFVIWSMGMLVLTFIQPFATVFGYIMEPWFVVAVFITGLCLIIIQKRKKVL